MLGVVSEVLLVAVWLPGNGANEASFGLYAGIAAVRHADPVRCRDTRAVL